MHYATDASVLNVTWHGRKPGCAGFYPSCWGAYHSFLVFLFDRHVALISSLLRNTKTQQIAFITKQFVKNWPAHTCTSTHLRNNPLALNRLNRPLHIVTGRWHLGCCYHYVNHMYIWVYIKFNYHVSTIKIKGRITPLHAGYHGNLHAKCLHAEV